MKDYAELPWGKLIYDNNLYEGNYMKDAQHNFKKHGYGTLKLKDGPSYKGSFFDDQIHGKGTMSLGNG